MYNSSSHKGGSVEVVYIYTVEYILVHTTRHYASTVGGVSLGNRVRVFLMYI